MKKLFLLISLLFLAGCTQQANLGVDSRIFTSGQVGRDPQPGDILQTTGTSSVWVATSTLGFSGSGSGSSTILQTNGTPNGSQTLLNLQQGTNVTLSDNGTGTVTINASGSGGGSTTTLNNTFIGIGSPDNTVTGTPLFTYNTSTRVLSVINVSSTNVTSTNLNTSGLTAVTLNVSGLSSLGALTFTNATGTGFLVVPTSTVTGGFFQTGMPDCDNAVTSKLLYDITTGKYSCGTDQTGGGSLVVDPSEIVWGAPDGTTTSSALLTFSTSTGLRNFITSTLTTTTIGMGTHLPNSPLHIGGSINSYLQANIQNLSSGGSASSDYVATADDGTDTKWFIDMGINSSLYNESAFDITGAHDGYLYVNGGNLAIGTASSTASVIKFFIGSTASTTEIARFTTSGLFMFINKGITTTNFFATSSNFINATSSRFFGTNGTFTNVTTTNINISGLTAFTNMNGTSITSTNFSFTRLNGTSITTTNFSYSIAVGTSITSTNFSGTRAVFTNVTSTNGNFPGLSFTNAVGTSITSTNFSGTTAFFTNVSSTNLNVSGITSLAGLTFTNATGTNISFSGQIKAPDNSILKSFYKDYGSQFPAVTTTFGEVMDLGLFLTTSTIKQCAGFIRCEGNCINPNVQVRFRHGTNINATTTANALFTTTSTITATTSVQTFCPSGCDVTAAFNDASIDTEEALWAQIVAVSSSPVLDLSLVCQADNS